MRLCYVVGARPNFVKMAPVLAALRARAPEAEHVLVHTGQHYDREMSDLFLEQLGVGEPDHMLGVGSGSHTAQTAAVMEGLERVLTEAPADLVLVPGDVNSTLGAALAAAKLQIPVAHVEAGLRSFDRTMPEELNRVIADTLSELLFVHSPEAVGNLEREGVEPERIHQVGNTMIDSIVAAMPRIEAARAAERLGIDGEYVLVTLHRPALVDGELLGDAMAALGDLAAEIPVVFPVHPRTRARLAAEGIEPAPGVRVLDPIGYLEFLSLERTATAVLTDSGGVQEETTFLGVPCFTLRANTERPITIERGTNTLLGLDPARIREIPRLLSESGGASGGDAPDGWDGRASERIAEVVCSHLS